MSDTQLVVSVVVQSALAALLLFVGAWGRAHADDLPPRHLPEEERLQRAAVMHRGSIACLVVGWIVAASVVYSVASKGAS